MNLLLQIGFSNACFALAVSIVAMFVATWVHRPHLSYMLWLLVLLRFVTPPIVTVPVGLTSIAPAAQTGAPPVGAAGFDLAAQSATAEPAPSLRSRLGDLIHAAKPWLASVWLLGSLFVCAWSVHCVRQFNHLLKKNTDPSPQKLQALVAAVAKQLKLRALPEVLVTSARLSPMVWWTGGRVQVVIPTSLLDELPVSEWRWVVAHELAHVRRRDYLVRWLEWLAVVCFWWNPVVWWAQRNLRAAEEMCCDALVISCLNPPPESYAKSILKAVEFLAFPDVRPPAMASEINSGGLLERRFRMMLSETPNGVNSRWLQVLGLLCAMLVLPFGVARAQDYEAVEQRLGEAVSDGELTLDQAALMIDALRKSNDAKDGNEREKPREDDRDGRYRQLAARLQAADRIRGALHERGLDREQIEDVLEVMPRVVHELNSKGERARFDPWLHKYLQEELELADEQIEVVQEIARRLVVGMDSDRQRDDERRRITRENYARVEKDLKNAVSEGRISGKDARARLAGMRRMLAGSTKRGEKSDWDGIKRRIEGAVERGDMTREEADAKYKEIKQKMSRATKGAEKDWSGIKRRIEGAVERGDLTREEADARYKEIKQRMSRETKGAEKDWDGLKRRIEGAVERGDLTREEADAKYRELKE